MRLEQARALAVGAGAVALVAVAAVVFLVGLGTSAYYLGQWTT